MTLESVTPAPIVGRRANQRERTRQALLTSARELLAQGQPVTVGRAAANALISEPTAYRYYSDARTLMREALAVQWSGLEEVVAEIMSMPEMAKRARFAAEAMARQVLAHEKAIRALVAISYEPGEAARGEGATTSRPAFRTILIDAVLDAQPTGMTKAASRRLRHALSVVIGAEAVFGLKDATDCSDSEAPSILGWSAFKIASEE